MKLAALALSAAVLGVMSITPASAATLGSAAPPSMAIKHAANADVVNVQFSTKRKANRRGYRKGYRQGYRAGRHYKHAPPGYRRYSSRPYGWQTRGCIVVGPVWWCP